MNCSSYCPIGPGCKDCLKLESQASPTRAPESAVDVVSSDSGGDTPVGFLGDFPYEFIDYLALPQPDELESEFANNPKYNLDEEIQRAKEDKLFPVFQKWLLETYPDLPDNYEWGVEEDLLEDLRDWVRFLGSTLGRFRSDIPVKTNQPSSDHVKSETAEPRKHFYSNTYGALLYVKHSQRSPKIHYIPNIYVKFLIL